MRTTLLTLPLLAALTLGGCATNAGGGFDISAVQNATVAACRFLPTASTVANIIAAGNPLLATAEAIAAAICAAVLPTAPAPLPPVLARRGVVVPTVNGVVIHGTFVR